MKKEFWSAEYASILSNFALNYLQEYVNCMHFGAGN